MGLALVHFQKYWLLIDCLFLFLFPFQIPKIPGGLKRDPQTPLSNGATDPTLGVDFMTWATKCDLSQIPD